MKSIVLALLAVSTVVAVQEVAAQSYSQGPFADEQALRDYWSTQPRPYPNGTAVSLDGRQIRYWLGFGPGTEVAYFNCHKTADIRINCSSFLDGTKDLSRLVDLIDTHDGTRPVKLDSRIYVNGTLYRDATDGFSSSKYLITCPAQFGYVFYWYEQQLPDFSPHVVRSCP